MLAKGNTTYIILERGVEDKALYEELKRMLNTMGLAQKGGLVEVYKFYPKTVQLMQALGHELRDQNPPSEDD